MQLSTAINQLFRGISNMLADSRYTQTFSGLSSEIDFLQKRLGEPLRIAVVGVMKAGKSTLMNALLKEKILYTNTLEATYTVSWFKYGEKPGLEIVFYDGTTQDAPFSDLEKWTVRPKDTEKHRLDDVKHVTIYYPNEILKTMELIDTPGLESTTEAASKHTQDFLGQKLSKEAAKITTENASQAEAIIYAFSRSVQGRDADVLDAFRGDAGNSSPINAIGLFTKADLYWNCAASPELNPLETVAEACGGYKKKLRDKLYTILPVVAKSVETVSNLDANTLDILTRLAAVDNPVLLEFLVDANFFENEPADSDMPISAEDRKRVLELFGQYGIYTIAQALRNGVIPKDLPDYMYKLSGVESASNLILRHFGNRGYLIKLDYILRRIRGMTNKIKHDNHMDKQIEKICERIAEDIDRLQEDEHSFRELELLQSYYNGAFKFTDPKLEEEFLQITGEYGSNVEARLGFGDKAGVREMKREAAARSQRWNGLAHNFGVSRQMNQAAEVIVRSCDNMYYYLDMLAGFDG